MVTATSLRVGHEFTINKNGVEFFYRTNNDRCTMWVNLALVVDDQVNWTVYADAGEIMSIVNFPDGTQITTSTTAVYGLCPKNQLPKVFKGMI